MRARHLPGALIVVSAVALALLQPPDALLRAYASRFYPWLQATLTPWSNRTTLPLFDVTWMAVVLLASAAWVWTLARAWRQRRRRASLIGRAALVTLMTAAVLYVWFTAAWGWHYRRAGVETTLPAFDAAATTPAAVRALAERAVAEATDCTSRRTRRVPALDAVPADLLASFHRVEARLGRPTRLVPSVPKRPWTAPYMRAVGVSGMLAPFYLETLPQP